MVECHDTAANASAAWVVVACHQWANTCIGTQDACGGKCWSELRTFGEKHFHFLISHSHIVASFDRHTVAGGTDHTHVVVRNKDVGVGWFAAAVNHHVVDTVSENEQSTLSREHINSDACHLGYEHTPNAGGIDGEVGIHFADFAGVLVAHLHAHHTSLVDNQLGHLVVSNHVGTMYASVNHIRHGQAEWID